MEKRMILAIVLSVVIMLVYQRLFMPAPEKASPPAQQQETAKPGVEESAVGTERAKPPAVTAPSVSGGLNPERENPLRWITVRTPLYTAIVSSAGGGIQSLSLNRYNDHPGPKGKPLDIIGSGEVRPLPMELNLAESQPPFPEVPVYASNAPDELSVKNGEEKTVSLSWESREGVRITREYTFSGGRYDFEVDQKVTNGTAGSLRLKPGTFLSQVFVGELGGDSYSFKGAVVGAGGKIDRLDFKKIKKGEIDKVAVQWAAADAKYFTLIAIPKKDWSLEQVSMLGEEGIRIALAGSPVVLGPQEVVSFSVQAFMGPKEYGLLGETGKGLEKLVDYGWFSLLAQPLVWLLTLFNRVTGNYGIDIIILTILIKIVFYPLTKKSMASMKKMQELGPIMKQIKEKYKDDKARQQQETMNLYKTYKINPMSGCLPMVLQIPVFIALYKGLLVAIELRHSPFMFWINDLSAPEHLWDIAVAGYTIPVRLLPLLMGVSMFVQQKLSPSGGMDPAQQKMMLFMPLIFTFMFWGFPTGLTIYWLMNNLLSIGQQLIQNRQVATEQAARA
ncbi:MAG: membrane protein insertase YidC [Deltaproteobacteria bacterium]|nr:membrane protein insertase YidC [Deltaproteobacteria bacterium]